ncbi:hypothetical protein T12_3763 [Trichinella patagoniensis]|uniref:Uncharacterized protein n=1 Tax=Trichinella patagoniensis TaxID=990121 RepID=A0A0V0YR54_9BILA|nr:hypothetical protein T12_3763 [Trichinella patagoniensis]
MKENRVAENKEILNKKAIYSTGTHLFAVELSRSF